MANKRLNLAIRADASETIGSGHVMRTLTLANALSDRGANVTFVCRRRAGDMHERIQGAGFHLVPLSVATDRDSWLGVSYGQEIDDSSEALSSINRLDLLVVDHYGIDRKWERTMRRFCSSLMVIDDLANREHDCEILLDQNLGAEENDPYQLLVPPHARLMLGPRFALLREQFRPFAEKVRERDGKITRILVFMGGFDSDNATEKVLRGIDDLTERPKVVDVVLPEEAPHAGFVAEHCKRRGYNYLGRVESMANAMEQADLSVGGVGSATWERCAVGLPAIALTLADNQRKGAHACEQRGAIVWLGDVAGTAPEHITAAIADLQSNQSRVRAMSAAARSVVSAEEGFPLDRVLNCIFEVVA